MISIPIKRGEFVALFGASGSINAGAASGTILTISPPSGQRVRVTNLSTAAGVNQASISILFDTTTVLSNKTISGGTPVASDARFSIGSYQDYAAGTPPSGNHPFITGKLNEPLVLSAGSITTQIIYYAYEFGE